MSAPEMSVWTSNPDEVSTLITARALRSPRPLLVALDGRSGAGKSTLALMLADRLGAALIEGDDFYAGGAALRSDGPESRAAACIDWTRQRSILEALAAGRDAAWRAFDWDAFDGRLRNELTTVEAKSIVILEGVYAARPELSDLLNVRVLLLVPDAVREARLATREGQIGRWERQWHEAEEFYFTKVMPSACFDIVLETSCSG
ncbi:hypothetical protein GRI75_12575 [Altererythrobacter soli]|uniref:Uncharacterized protein n=1 Tax=Croceibacterium soli TaxID=1739690 RepID=A0A6I4UV98_9SPHN|nr:(d)CMP kinase [Croceibacterium soli]MXP42476.1 hypothetical protein [Croceibacterium soli]